MRSKSTNYIYRRKLSLYYLTFLKNKKRPKEPLGFFGRFLLTCQSCISYASLS